MTSVSSRTQSPLKFEDIRLPGNNKYGSVRNVAEAAGVCQCFTNLSANIRIILSHQQLPSVLVLNRYITDKLKAPMAEGESDERVTKLRQHCKVIKTVSL